MKCSAGRPGRLRRGIVAPLLLTIVVVLGPGLPNAAPQEPASPPPDAPITASRSPEPRFSPPYSPRDARIPLTERLSEDPETRILELVYVLRHYVPFRRDEELVQAIRELSRIGKPAAEKLIDELERTRNEATLRVLAIALRTTNDPAAIPALIRAISRTARPEYGYCRLLLIGPDLREFASTLEAHPVLALPTMRLDLAVNEIVTTLERLSGERVPGGEPDIGGTPDLAKHGRERWQQLLPDLQSQVFFRRQEAWRDWWKRKQGEDPLPPEPAQGKGPPAAPVVAPPPPSLPDRVEQAGEARFGPIFPTGPDARLRPVRAVALFDTLYADVPSAIDLDTGRGSRLLEGSPPTAEGYRTWTQRRGIDLVVRENWEDATAWEIEADRWETIDAEIRRAGPLRRGPMLPDRAMVLPLGRTMLFTTREGGSGILQVSELRPDGSWQFRYRMWETPFAAGAGEAAAPGTAASLPDVPAPPAAPQQWGEVIDVTLQAPGEERSCGWSLSRQEYVALPRHILSRELSDQLGLKGEEMPLHVWRRKERVSFLTRRASPIDQQRSIEVDLFLMDCVVRRVHPGAFATMSAATATQLLDEPAAGPRQSAVQFVRDPTRPQPQTYLFRSSVGEAGLMQMRGSSLTGGLPTFRYKLLESVPMR